MSEFEVSRSVVKVALKRLGLFKEAQEATRTS
jgi:hypothetical protein